ncbi:MAG: HD domain-containing phosphohydrolase, partial [Candidatus Electryoneaceae bacterium]|nr:HD domain-containing phosphohydrolase [Candidatus Electryoneaceae bacterium]
MSQEDVQEEGVRLSPDHQVNALLNEIVKRLRDYTDTQVKNLNELAKIGVALTATRNLDQLLELIIDKARSFTHADGGTLYLVSDDEQFLNFTIVQTESLKIRMGGITGEPINWPPVPLFIDGEPNNSNVCTHAVNTGRVVNIADVYEVDEFNFEGARKFDANTGYRSQSMLVVPMRDHEGEIIGVLQLLNAKDQETWETVPFDPRSRDLTKALASQAAVAITNARLIQDMQNLFEAFIQTIATAIDEKSPYTGGHIERVANLTMDIAKRISEADDGPFVDVHLSEDELSELRLAAWLHDTGKITTPEYVVDKHTKLETIFDRRELIRFRFEIAIAHVRRQAAEARGKLYESGSWTSRELETIENKTNALLRQIRDDYQFVMSCNITSEFVPDEVIERLKQIASTGIETSLGSENPNGMEPLITPNELYNLMVRKGNLTPEERYIINNHVAVTKKMLMQMPFPKKLRQVPEFAGAHHEKLDGSGYPEGLIGDEIPLQARIMGVADIFEALCSRDRP